MATSSASGRTGPERDQIAYGTLIQCLTGWATLSAHPGRPPRSAGGVWTDPLTASFETLLVLAALWRQQRDGVGCLIDLSMAETTIAALPEPVLAWSLAHEVLEPRGNRHPRYAPQGCYPATGDDQWVALSVQSDAAWPVLCDLMQRPDLRADPTLATAAGRQAQHDALDTAIAAWTRARPGADTAAILQAHGIAATATLTPSDVASDPQLQARSFVSQIEQSDGQGTFTSPGVPWLIDGHRLHSQRRAPTLGEDNDAVFTSLLGLDEQTYAELIRTEIIY
jgi:benzylsuccinate CoA-transferase BbsF subunit